MSTTLQLTVLTINLFNDRSDPEDLDRLLSESSPDLVAAQELGPDAARVLERHYDNGLLRPQSDYNGMGLALSVRADVEEIATPDPRALVADLESLRGEDGFKMICARLPPPLSHKFLLERRRYVQFLVELIDEHEGAMCLMGDLNATPYWPAYRVLARRLQDGIGSNTRQSTRGFATWPAKFPMFGIDHILARGASISNLRRVSVAGTDHKGLLGTIDC